MTADQLELNSGTSCERAAQGHYQQAAQHLASLGLEHLGPYPRRRDMVRDGGLVALVLNPVSALRAIRHIGLAQEQLRIDAVVHNKL